MQVFLIRHAHAVNAEVDAERPLSKRGRKQVRQLARFFAEKEILQFAELWHSPLARSKETAELLKKEMDLTVRLVEIESLEGGNDPVLLVDRLKTRRSSTALVGHEPQLSALASLLVAGVAEPSRFILQKSAVLALERTGGNWAVCWQVSPDVIRRR